MDTLAFSYSSMGTSGVMCDPLSLRFVTCYMTDRSQLIRVCGIARLETPCNGA